MIILRRVAIATDCFSFIITDDVHMNIICFMPLKSKLYVFCVCKCDCFSFLLFVFLLLHFTKYISKQTNKQKKRRKTFPYQLMLNLLREILRCVYKLTYLNIEYIQFHICHLIFCVYNIKFQSFHLFSFIFIFIFLFLHLFCLFHSARFINKMVLLLLLSSSSSISIIISNMVLVSVDVHKS